MLLGSESRFGQRVRVSDSGMPMLMPNNRLRCLNPGTFRQLLLKGLKSLKKNETKTRATISVLLSQLFLLSSDTPIIRRKHAGDTYGVPDEHH